MSIFGGGRGALDQVRLEEPIDAPRDIPYTPKVQTPVPFTPFMGTSAGQPFHSLQFGPNPNREAYSQHFKTWYENYANERTGRVKFNNLDDYDKFFQSIPGGGNQIGDQMMEVYMKGMPDYIKAEYDTLQKQRQVDTASKLNEDRLKQLNAQYPDSDNRWVVNPVNGEVVEVPKPVEERLARRKQIVEKLYQDMTPEEKQVHELSYDQEGFRIIRSKTDDFVAGPGGSAGGKKPQGTQADVDNSQRLGRSIIVEDVGPQGAGSITTGKGEAVTTADLQQEKQPIQRITLSGRALRAFTKERPDMVSKVVDGVLTLTLPKEKATGLVSRLSQQLREELDLANGPAKIPALEGLVSDGWGGFM